MNEYFIHKDFDTTKPLFFNEWRPDNEKWLQNLRLVEYCVGRNPQNLDF